MIITARIRMMSEGNSFSLFVSPHLGEGGTPSLSHNTSTGPMSFSREVPQPGQDGKPPMSRSGQGVPRPGQDGGTP